ncbi:hypothetical protein [Brunnivagina elsteri]|uniref:hypothetical protein n=1 Tax=Brunnivagina elsteri TaxID=1247191 RepID=UPI001B806509|nr:hypothetical protein [Calothrix elsteri]
MSKQKPYYYSNNLDDFKIPYSIYGNNDYEVMKAKYLQLSNNPLRITSKRFIFNQW